MDEEVVVLDTTVEFLGCVCRVCEVLLKVGMRAVEVKPLLLEGLVSGVAARGAMAAEWKATLTVGALESIPKELIELSISTEEVWVGPDIILALDDGLSVDDGSQTGELANEEGVSSKLASSSPFSSCGSLSTTCVITTC
jgi:hypothetical protein